jgi:hypothetical protein
MVAKSASGSELRSALVRFGPRWTAGDWLRSTTSISSLCGSRFSGPSALRSSRFADYRVPQILHSAGILRYSDHLRRLLEEKALLPYGSPEEGTRRDRCSVLAHCDSVHPVFEHSRRG